MSTKSTLILVLFYFLIPLEALNSQENSSIPKLDKTPVLKLLKYDLWTEDYAYDAAHFLMVPMHFAFQKHDTELIIEFDSFFSRFYKDKESFLEIKNQLKRLQFNYFVSQYLTLKLKSFGDSNELTEALTEYLKKELLYYYYKAKAFNWKYPDNDNYEFNGYRTRMFWKLTSDMDSSYYKKAIIDEELFLIGIAADLSRLFLCSQLSDHEPSISATLVEINALAYIIFASRFKEYKSGLVFQSGYFSRHRDFKYANCFTLECIKNGPAPIEDIAPDTSHSIRLPLILSSLEQANKEDQKQFLFYRQTKAGLAKQLNNNVIKIEKAGKQIRITNYLDGRNGFYRWNYETNKGNGYGPYEVGETFKLGWWTFLDDPKIKSVYDQISKNLYDGVPAEYEFQDKTNRVRNPIIANRYENGLYITITSMASQLQRTN